ncbi:abscisic acid-deficient protein Aba4 family protein [Mucilaginibacter gynuensis]|uniref:abscisic acid-deficient protein Aba4 family protein n=1 Tax=Mucilaginibacter gynuensis TaxID=1302236 RepID=UPI003CD0C328
MTSENSFAVLSIISGLNWLLLILFPTCLLVRRLTLYGTVALLSLCYFLLMWKTNYLFVTQGLSSYQAYKTVLGIDNLVLAGWAHYLAFDLLVGLYINKISEANSLSRWLVVPIMVTTYFLGPIGFLAFLVVKTVTTNIKSFFHEL